MVGKTQKQQQQQQNENKTRLERIETKQTVENFFRHK